MTSRREFLAGLAGAGLCAWPVTAPAQHQTRRIGYLSLRKEPGILDEEFLAALRALGYVEGRNLQIEYRWAGEDEERLPTLAAELAWLKVEVIVTSTLPAISAARDATSKIPIVMQSAADPVGAGLVADLAHPGGNVTGISILSTELAAKRLQIMQEFVPRSKRTALLAIDNAFATPLLIVAAQDAARRLRLDLLVQLIKTEADLPKAFEALKRAGAGSLLVQTNPLFGNRREQIVELAAQARLPAMYEIRGYVESGGLISYGPDPIHLFRRSAVFVDRILKGARAGDLPIEQPTKYELALNAGVAKKLGLTIPPSLLARADTVL